MSFKETDKFKVSVIDGAYFLVEIKEDAQFEREDMIQLVNCEKQISGRRLPVLVICSATASCSTEFVKYLSKNVNDPLAIADAFVLKSISQKILAHFYKLFGNHERPISFFNTQADAMKWLNQFIE